MADPTPKLKNAPIVEALLDIECDMPAGLKITDLEKPANAAFHEQYPQFRAIAMQEHRLETKPDSEPKISMQQSVHGFQFLKEDGRQLVQLRSQGFSFNRLAPYTTLDDYLPEMERAWKLYVKLASPVKIRTIRLRYINRILLPMINGGVKLETYLNVCPRLPDEERLEFIGFLNQHTAFEKDTGNLVNTMLATQTPQENKLPILFDITAAKAVAFEGTDWAAITPIINSLRLLKNSVFHNTLTEECLNLFDN